MNIITNLTQFYIPNKHHHKPITCVNNIINLGAISIWAKNAIIGNYFSWSFHHCKGDFKSLSFIAICWYNDNSVFTKERWASLVETWINPHSLMMEAKEVELATHLRFRCLTTFIKRGTKTCSLYFLTYHYLHIS